MKKLLKLVVPVVLSILPSWGMEDAVTLHTDHRPSSSDLRHLESIKMSFFEKLNIIEIQDPFFTDPRTNCSIINVIEMENGGKEKDFIVQVSVKDHESFTKSQLIIPSWISSGWKYNDDGLFGQEIVNLSVICGIKMITKEYTRTLRHPYKHIETYDFTFYKGIKNTFVSRDKLPVNERFEVRKVFTVIRPGSHIPYDIVGPILYYEMNVLDNSRVGYQSIKCIKIYDQVEKK